MSLKNVITRPGAIEPRLDCVIVSRRTLKSRQFFAVYRLQKIQIDLTPTIGVSSICTTRQHQRWGYKMTKQHAIDWYVMFLILLLMLWSTVPLYIAYSLQHG